MHTCSFDQQGVTVGAACLVLALCGVMDEQKWVFLQYSIINSSFKCVIKSKVFLRVDVDFDI